MSLGSVIVIVTVFQNLSTGGLQWMEMALIMLSIEDHGDDWRDWWIWSGFK